MIMKKTLLIAMAAASIFAGCSRNDVIDVNQENAISFENTFVDNITRADATPKDLTQFHVTSVMTKEAETALVFNEQEVNKSGSEWTYTPPQYWFAGWDYEFVAWNGGEIFFDTQYGSALNAYQNNAYCLEINNNNDGYNGDRDIVTAKQTVKDVTEGYKTPVSLQFSHILSRVKFGFTNAMGNDLITLKVKNIKIKDACAFGEYNLRAGDWAGTGSTPVEYTFTETNMINNATKENSGVKYLIPGFYDKKVYNSAFTVEVYNDGVLVETKNMTAPINLEAALVKGTSYEINAEITAEALALNQIVFNNITVKVWGDYNNQGITPVETK